MRPKERITRFRVNKTFVKISSDFIRQSIAAVPFFPCETEGTVRLVSLTGRVFGLPRGYPGLL